MSDLTPAQEEFNRLVANNSTSRDTYAHPEDLDEERHYLATAPQDIDEEDEYRNSQIDAAMRIPAFDRLNGPAADLKLPPVHFDSGHSTGVKGVIADARSYETARRSRFRDAVRTARQSVMGLGGHVSNSNNNNITGRNRSRSRSGSDSDGDSGSDLFSDEENFLQQWRESRRKELESESNRSIRTRRTSPSARIYGRFDEVDALGYLDAIEKVGRETVVVVFVYDHECLVSAEVERALVPLVSRNPTVHFVKVHYEDIEFDNAGVPAVLAYRNQGDLIANLTGMVEMMPDDDSFDSDTLKELFQRHSIL